jgi:hypothetical protein
MVESVRWRRLRWRLRGAWQWPAFAVLTVADAALVAWFPFQGEGGDFWGAVLLAGFFNLVAVAVAAPFLAMALRRRRRDLPFVIARDYAGTALLVTIFAALLLGGVLHRGVRAEQRDARAASELAVRGWLAREEPAFAPITAVDTRELEPENYRACAYTAQDRLPICFFVNTDQSPPGLVRDTERLPNRP